jgi:outer membrane cobalamin receptor
MRISNFNAFRNAYLIIILYLTISGLSALKVTAEIHNSKSQPIADVTITDGYHRVYSNAKGQFSINTAADSLSFSKLGYQKQKIAVNKIGQFIILTAKPVILSTVRVTERYDSASPALDKTILSADADSKTSQPLEALLKESSLQSSGTKLMGENQTLSLLGNLSRHTLVMLDNVPLNPNGEAYDLSNLPLDTIKQIEIVKGNASLYGGASAIGGIVYLYTNAAGTPVALRLERETSHGSFSQIKRNQVMELKSAPFSYRIALSKQSAENDFTYKPRPWWHLNGKLKRENNGKKQQDVSFKMSSNLDKIYWVYSLDAQQLYRELPGPVNFLSVYKNAYLDGQNLRQNLNLSYAKDKLDNSLILWQNEDHTRYNNTRATNPIYPTLYQQNHASLGAKNQTTYSFEPANLSLGLELTRQSYERKDLLSPALSIPETRRKQGAVSLKASNESQWQYLTNNVQAGIRLDDVTDFGTFTSWRLEEQLKTDTDVQLQAGATIGNSFSLPSFYDLYWKGDAQSLGNPALEPETSMGGSIRAGISMNNYSLKAAYYSSEVKKLIQWRQTYLFGTQWKPVNIGKAEINNLEFELKAKPFDWIALNSSLTLTRAKDKSDGNNYNLTYTPQTKWVAEMIHTHKDFTFILNLDYTGKQWTTKDNLVAPIPSILLLNSSLKYKYSYKKISADIFVQLNNLFDKQYEIYAYVPQPGFNWLVGLNLVYCM